jgi:pyruvate dehydrogenase E2 component (dihydrolipoamide acetyltransferase)
MDIVLPSLGEDITHATVACWHVQAGDLVQAGDEVVEVVTDKASFSIEAPAAGKVKSIAYKQGEDCPVGGVLGVIEQTL